jgi:hypothetical protein
MLVSHSTVALRRHCGFELGQVMTVGDAGAVAAEVARVMVVTVGMVQSP